MNEPRQQPESDSWIDRQLRDVAVPDDLVARLQFVSQIDDEALDERLCEVPVPAGLVERLQLIAQPIQRRFNATSWTAAAALLLAVSISYFGAMAGLVASAYHLPERPPTLSVELVGSWGEAEVGELVAVQLQPTVVDAGPPLVLEETSLEVELEAAADEAMAAVTAEVDFAELVNQLPLELDVPTQQWSGVEQILGAAVDAESDQMPELMRAPRQTPQGISPPLQLGWDRPWFFRHRTHPALLLDRNPRLQMVQVPLAGEPYSYALARRELELGQLPDPRDVHVEDFLAALEYGFPEPKQQDLRVHLAAGPSPFAGAAQASGGGGRLSTLFQIGVRVRSVTESVRPASRLTVLVDCSRSMSRGGRMAMTKLALADLIRELGPADRLTLLAFNEQAEVLFVDGTKQDEENLLEALDALRADGATNIAAGLRRAYGEALSHETGDGLEHRVALVTDGLTRLSNRVFDTLETAIRSSAARGVTLSIIDVGDTREPDPQLIRFARAGRVRRQAPRLHRAGTVEQIRWSLIETLTGQSQLVAEEASMTVHFNPKVVRSYRLIGHEALDPQNKGGDLKCKLRSGQTATALFELELRANRGPLAHVRVSWHDPWQQMDKEEEQTLEAEAVAKTFAGSDVSLQRAAVAAEVAEILRRSPFAESPSLDRVLPVAAAVKEETDGLGRFQEFVEFIQEASQQQGGRAARRPPSRR